ncbi:putative notchless, partial [Toxoplasma gondii TgCatPRC2]
IERPRSEGVEEL